MMHCSAALLLLLSAFASPADGSYQRDLETHGISNPKLVVNVLRRRLEDNETVVACDPDVYNCTDADHDHSAEDHDDHLGEATNDSKAHSEGKPWGPALLAALLVNLCTLIGVVAFLPASYISRTASVGTKEYIFHIVIPSFACGALMATSVFLLIPEAIHLLSGVSDERDHRHLENTENQAAWKFGVSVMGGYFIPFVFSGIFPHSHVPKDDDIDLCPVDAASALEPRSHAGAADNVGKDAEGIDVTVVGAKVDKLASKQIIINPDYRLASSVLVGDFFHNFADGIFIGTAFLLCTRSIAITVTATSVFHELSQELADYFLLTNQCGLPPWKALALNFISGLSVMLGVVVIMATDVSEESVGVLLSMSAGVYMYIALTECAPRIHHYIVDIQTRVLSFVFWTIGAVPIGLVLLSHEHCD